MGKNLEIPLGCTVPEAVARAIGKVTDNDGNIVATVEQIETVSAQNGSQGR